MPDQTDDFIEETELSGVFIIKRPTFEDDRGFFREIFRKSDLEKRLGHEFTVAQPNHSRSIKGILRGIHVATWMKLVTVTRGKVQQVVIDLREDSPTFGKYISLTLGGNDNRYSVFIPPGMGNAFAVLSDVADYMYFTSDYWAPGKEKYIIYNDPDLNVKWELENPSISEKDLAGVPVRELFPNKFT